MSALGHAPPARPYPWRTIYRIARSRSLDQLGTARSLQPQRAGVYPRVLADGGAKIVILVNMNADRLEAIACRLARAG